MKERETASALRYEVGGQTVEPGGELSLAACAIRAVGGICGEDERSLRLSPGRWLLNFWADAERPGGGELGAVFAVNSAPLRYTAARLTAPESGAVRLVLGGILDLTAEARLSVVNDGEGALCCRSCVLTAVRLD